MNSSKVAKELKDILTSEFAGVKFSVRQTRKNAYIGQLLEVNWTGEITDDIHDTTRLFEAQHFGYTVEAKGTVRSTTRSMFRIVGA